MRPLLILCSLFLFVHVAVEAAAPMPPIGSLEDLFEDDFGGFSDKTVQFGNRKNVAFSAVIATNSADTFLIVQAKIEPGWHLYSITQPKKNGLGPIRGEFTLTPSEDYQLPYPLRTASELHLETSDVFDGLLIESHVNNAAWIAHIRIMPGKTLETLQISGSFNGQVCEGEGGVCVLVNDETFEAVYDPDFDVTPFLGKTDDRPSIFAAATEITKETQFTPNETETVDSLLQVLLFAFLGGMILNIMPCVLPVIGLKILAFFEQAGKNRLHAFALNVWYTVGILAVFLVLTFLSVGLNRMFSYDLFNVVMACVVFAMALSLMEIWELQVPGFLGSGKSVELMEKEGIVGAVFKGIITTLLAIPCGAPLLSTALLWADNQIRAGATHNVFLAYTFIGLGMAAPFLVLGAFPELLRFLPKPGMWMITFKKFMGFFLLTAVVWILYYISLSCIVPTVALLFAVWFGCWFIGRLPLTAPASERGVAWLVSLLIVGLVLSFSFDLPKVDNPYTLQKAMQNRLNESAGVTNDEHWTPFTVEKLNAALAEGKLVLVDFTADWCLSCKYFEKTVLQTDEIKTLLEQKGIVSLKADCTKTEMEGAVFLARFGSGSVPVLMLFTPEDPTTPTIIRGGFYKQTVLELLK
ncbi:MAG: thioredoxin family protein [Planctomycetaceae bacterium]|nr:thioredoxin family protein [Planctomycetaceae bacterium]